MIVSKVARFKTNFMKFAHNLKKFVLYVTRDILYLYNFLVLSFVIEKARRARMHAELGHDRMQDAMADACLKLHG